jgi:hypothetical protein
MATLRNIDIIILNIFNLFLIGGKNYEIKYFINSNIKLLKPKTYFM